MESKIKGFHHVLRCPVNKKYKSRMLISETSAAAIPLTRFRGLARVPDIRAGVPSSARVPGVVPGAHPPYFKGEGVLKNTRSSTHERIKKILVGG